MANTDPIFVSGPKTAGVTLTTTTLTTLFTAGASGAYIKELWIYPDASYTGGGKFQLWVNDGSADRLIGEKSLTASTGFSALDGSLFPAELQLAASAIIKVKATIVSAGSVYATITAGGDY
jgi:hypothetical protein